MYRLLLVFPVACYFVLGGCAALPEPAFDRVDGKPIEAGSVEETKLKLDEATCQSDVDRVRFAPASPSGLVYEGAFDVDERLNVAANTARRCMISKGYVVVASRTHYQTTSLVDITGNNNGYIPDEYFMSLTSIPHN